MSGQKDSEVSIIKQNASCEVGGSFINLIAKILIEGGPLHRNGVGGEGLLETAKNAKWGKIAVQGTISVIYCVLDQNTAKKKPGRGRA